MTRGPTTEVDLARHRLPPTQGRFPLAAAGPRHRRRRHHWERRTAMPLTSFVRRPDIQAAWSRHGVVPPTSPGLTRALKAPVLTPSDGSEPDWALIGTAFDYALRFKLERLGRQRGNRVLRHDRLYAELSLNSMWRPILGIQRLPDGVIADLTAKMATVQDPLAAHADGRWDDDRRLAALCLWLADLDGYAREGRFDPAAPLREVTRTDLLAIIAATDFVALADQLGDQVALNPGLALARQVGGADADLVTPHLVVDIKTTMRSPVTAANLLQMAAYATLIRAGGLAIAPSWRGVEAVGLYSARHARLLRWPLADLYRSPEDQAAFERIFCRACGVTPPMRRPPLHWRHGGA